MTNDSTKENSRIPLDDDHREAAASSGRPNVLPDILAPAGNADSFKAALAAGADAIYAGLKAFSARMQADNFSVAELAALTELAHAKGVKVYVPMNNLVKPDETTDAGRLLQRLQKYVRPDGVIVQDVGMVELARQAGFEGEMHLSSLAAVGIPSAMAGVVRDLGVSRVVLPRELNVDEMKAFAQACPPGMSLEVFVHGALCYNVSGRCWWSSRLGGRSALRGRCVQPCRRKYAYGSSKTEYFSCRDLSLDVLAGTLLTIPQISAWKIEGRKKGPHYVFYTVSAYAMLRDHPGETQAKKTAEDLLSRALGRPRSHSVFLPQRPHNPTEKTSGRLDETASGLFIGKISASETGGVTVKTRIPLLNGDLLRVGCEDDNFHRTVPVRRGIPKNGNLDIPAPKERMRKRPPSGAPVYLVDRREPELKALLADMGRELGRISPPKTSAATFKPQLPKPDSLIPGRTKPLTMILRRGPVAGKESAATGLWLNDRALNLASRTMYGRIWWWLPPIVWPNEEKAYAAMIGKVVAGGGRKFVLGSPWQASLFPDKHENEVRMWAGPFCNVANVLALKVLKDLGFAGVFVSPELSAKELLALPAAAPLPLGIVISGAWPMGVSRLQPDKTKPNRTFASPRGEGCYYRVYGENIWIFGDSELDLREHEQELAAAGYSLLAHLRESKPKELLKPERGGRFQRGEPQIKTDEFNWTGGAL